jgi:hypothetical protein
MAKLTDKKLQVLVEKSLHPSLGCPKTTIEKRLASRNNVHNAAIKCRYRSYLK